MKHLALSFYLAVALGVAITGSALAHANLLRSEPAPGAVLAEPPQEVRLWFSEPLEPGFSLLQVLDSTGGPVDLRDSRLEARDPKLLVVSLGPLSQGYYTVAWRALSRIDGHVTKGSFSFSVGVASAQPGPTPNRAKRASFPPAEPALRWLTLIGAAALTGGFTFRLFILRSPSPPQPGDGQGVLQRWQKNALRVFAGGMALAVIGSLGALLQQAAALGEGLPTLSSLGQALSTRWGQVWLARMLVLAALSLVLLSLPKIKRVWPWGAGLGLSLGLLLTLSLNSHAAATADPLTLTLDILHLVAAALWLGGLLHFGVALIPALQGAPQEARGWLLRALLPRFSALAAACVLVLLVTGLYAWWVQVGVLGPALDTVYGQALRAKVALNLPLLALAALNLLYLSPRLERPLIQAWFRALVRAEGLLALLVLLSVGFLTTVPPARQELAARPSPIHFGGQTQGVLYHGQISPGQVGWNTYQVWLWDKEGNPLSRVREVGLRFTFLSAEVGRSEVVLQPGGPGEFSAQGGHLALNGPWRAELSVRREGAYDLRQTIRFRVPNTIVSATPPTLSQAWPWRREGEKGP